MKRNAQKPKYDIDGVHILLPHEQFSRSTEVMHDRNQGTSTLYTDGGQILLASASTLEWMNRDLRHQNGERFQDLSLDGFRPNMGVDGFPPNVEDIIDEVRIHGVQGPIRMLFGELSVRCPVTQVNQKTGQRRADKQPLVWLAKNRPPRPGKPNSTTFAVNTAFPLDQIGKVISVGDTVEIVKEKQ